MNTAMQMTINNMTAAQLTANQILADAWVNAVSRSVLGGFDAVRQATDAQWSFAHAAMGASNDDKPTMGLHGYGDEDDMPLRVIHGPNVAPGPAAVAHEMPTLSVDDQR